jgi:MFS transporter, MHS family, proline/betaine transporter
MRKTTSLAHVAVTANILQWYDFSISAYLAFVLGPLFFGGHDDFTALIQSFSVFAVSYLMRPLGGMAFGYLGNRQNAGVALRWSILLMAIPTVLIGLLPTYRDIGYTATILMVTLKLIQGFAAGGELPTSAYYVMSQADPLKKGLLSSLVDAGGISGLLLASLLAFLLSGLFSNQQIEHWAWRIPFLLGIPFFLLVSKIRSRIIVNEPISAQRCENNKITDPKIQMYLSEVRC